MLLATLSFWQVVGAGLIFIAAILLLFVVIFTFIDNFQRKDHSGWAKAGWTILILFFPILGIILYIIARPAEA